MTTSEAPADGADADVRARIVSAALDLFATKGYAGTSLREIVGAARTTKPMIYYYFRSKEGPYTSMLGERLQAFAGAIDRATHAGSDPYEKLRAFADAYLRCFEAQEPHVAFVVREVFGLGADSAASFGRYLDERIFTRLKRILDDGVERHCFRTCDTSACSVAILGIPNMFILRRIFGEVPLDRDAAIGQVIDVYITGLRRA